MSLQNIISSSARANGQGAETHRLSAISNIENALETGGYPEQTTKRLRRLLRILRDSENDDCHRKLAVLQLNVIPALQTLGLVEDETC